MTRKQRPPLPPLEESARRGKPIPIRPLGLRAEDVRSLGEATQNVMIALQPLTDDERWRVVNAVRVLLSAAEFDDA